MNSRNNDPFRLDGRHALVTGGTQGVGAAIAVGIAAAGAHVTLLGLHDDRHAQQTMAECRSVGAKCDLVVCDLALPPDQLIQQILGDSDDLLRNVDLLVNNAGVFIDVPFLEMDAQRYQQTMNINVRSGYFLTQAFARRWIDRGTRGRVLFTGSINGQLAEPDHTAYDASKGAVASMVRSLCVALAPHGIRVNSMAPGLIRTPLTAEVIDQPRFNQWMKTHTPNGAIPEPDSCAGTAVFLLSDAAEHVHGQTLLVDGGISALQVPDQR